MVSKPITSCPVTRWGSTPHGMKCPQRTKAVSAARPLERGVYCTTVGFDTCAAANPSTIMAWGGRDDIHHAPQRALRFQCPLCRAWLEVVSRAVMSSSEPSRHRCCRWPLTARNQRSMTMYCASDFFKTDHMHNLVIGLIN